MAAAEGQPRRFDGKRLLLASHNQGKLRELEALLAPFNVAVVSAGALGLPEPEETGTSFVANAVLKAEAAANTAGVPALSDDSGLAVDGLDGDPGIYSARWGGPERDFNRAMAEVARLLEERHGPDAAGDNPAWRGRFVSALALCWPDGHVETVEGVVTGRVVWPKRGGNGFGYDPIFRPDGSDLTFGEMVPAEKMRVDHRAHAFRQLVERCFR